MKRAAWIMSAAMAVGLLSARISAAAQPLYVVTHVDVVPDHVADGETLLTEEGAQSRRDPGCLSWDLLQQSDRPNHFTIVEAWAATADFDRHVASDHTKAMRAKLQAILGSPFDERLHRKIP